MRRGRRLPTEIPPHPWISILPGSIGGILRRASATAQCFYWISPNGRSDRGCHVECSSWPLLFLDQYAFIRFDTCSRSAFPIHLRPRRRTGGVWLVSAEEAGASVEWESCTSSDKVIALSSLFFSS